MKVSFKIQNDNSFPRINNQKTHFRYIGVYILGSRWLSENSFLITWRQDAIASLIFRNEFNRHRTPWIPSLSVQAIALRWRKKTLRAI